MQRSPRTLVIPFWAACSYSMGIGAGNALQRRRSSIWRCVPLVLLVCLKVLAAMLPLRPFLSPGFCANGAASHGMSYRTRCVRRFPTGVHAIGRGCFQGGAAVSAPVLPGRDAAGRSSTNVYGHRHPASGTTRGLTSVPVGASGVVFNDSGSAWDADSARHSELDTADHLRASWQSSASGRSGVRSEDGDPPGPEAVVPPPSTASRRSVGDATGAPTSQLVASLFQGVHGHGSRTSGSFRRHDRNSGDDASIDEDAYHPRSGRSNDRPRKSSFKHSRSHKHGHKPPRHHHSESDQYSDDDTGGDGQDGQPPADADAVKELEEHTAALKLEIAKQEAETRRLAQQRAECDETAKQLAKEVTC